LIDRDDGNIIIYEGWFVGGKQWGRGRLIAADTWNNSLIWSEGEFILGRGYGEIRQEFVRGQTGIKSFHGKLGYSGFEGPNGRLVLQDGSIYRGGFKDSKRNGLGVIDTKQFRSQGYFIDD